MNQSDEFTDFQEVHSLANNVLLALLSGGSQLSASLLAQKAYAVSMAMQSEADKVFLKMGESAEKELEALPSFWKSV